MEKCYREWADRADVLPWPISPGAWKFPGMQRAGTFYMRDRHGHKIAAVGSKPMSKNHGGPSHQCNSVSLCVSIAPSTKNTSRYVPDAWNWPVSSRPSQTNW